MHLCDRPMKKHVNLEKQKYKWSKPVLQARHLPQGKATKRHPAFPLSTLNPNNSPWSIIVLWDLPTQAPTGFRSNQDPAGCMGRPRALASPSTNPSLKVRENPFFGSSTGWVSFATHLANPCSLNCFCLPHLDIQCCIIQALRLTDLMHMHCVPGTFVQVLNYLPTIFLFLLHSIKKYLATILCGAAQPSFKSSTCCLEWLWKKLAVTICNEICVTRPGPIQRSPSFLSASKWPLWNPPLPPFLLFRVHLLWCGLPLLFQPQAPSQKEKTLQKLWTTSPQVFLSQSLLPQVGSKKEKGRLGRQKKRNFAAKLMQKR